MIAATLVTLLDLTPPRFPAGRETIPRLRQSAATYELGRRNPGENSDFSRFYHSPF